MLGSVICTTASGSEYEVLEDGRILKAGTPIRFDSTGPVIRYYGLADGQAMRQEWADYYQMPPYNTEQGATVEGMMNAFYDMERRKGFVLKVPLEQIVKQVDGRKSLVGIVKPGEYDPEKGYLVVTSPITRARKKQ
jgi:hypothetical protein